jgi:hypothetical protein
MTASRPGRAAAPPAPLPLDVLKDLERKVLWLATWTIHHANHVRDTARRPQGRRAPGLVGLAGDDHDGALFRRAAPRGPGRGQAACEPGLPRHPVSARQPEPSRSSRTFRGFGGAQSYPSRTKDADDVDFSTGSVGLGVAMTLVRQPRAGLRPGQGLGPPKWPGAAWSRSSAMPSSTRATSTRPCSRAGSTGCATPGGSSTTTARASTPCCPT